MKKETLKKILEEKSVSFTASELSQIIDEELEKSAEEMDTDLIDSCLDALEELKAKETEKTRNQQRRRIKLSKVLFVAAILIVILSIAIPACAKFLHVDAAEKVVQYYSDHFLVDLSNKNEGENSVVDILKDNGMERIYLPAELAGSYGKAFVSDTGDFTKLLTINTSIRDIDCQLVVGLYSDLENTTFGETITPDDYTNIKQLTVGDLDILVFSDDKNSYIYYADNGNEYNILLSDDFDDVVSIAETIEELK